MTTVASGDDLPEPLLDPEEQLQARVAWHYFIGNLTQQQIADRLGTSRVRVNRLLAACRENGLVQITINSKLASCVELEHRLLETYALHEAVVVPTPDDVTYLRDAIGVGAGTYLSSVVSDGCTIAIGWGRTLRAILRAMPSRNLSEVSVVCLQGGLAHCSGINTFEIVSDFADLYGADQHFFAAPIFASNEAARDVILAQGAIRETYEKARAADVAVITAGDMNESLIVTYGVETSADRESLVDGGAVGDIIGHFIDADGQEVDHPLNRRTVAVSLEDLKQIRRVVLAAGGMHRFDVVRAALRGGLASVFVTDEATATALVDNP